MSENTVYEVRNFTSKREAYSFASRVAGYVEGPFYDYDLNTKYLVFYKDAREELANGVTINGINWWWCLYDSRDIAEKVQRACEMVAPESTISDVCKATYKGIIAYGFRIHK